MVIVLKNADDERNQLNDHTAEQQENIPSHVHIPHLPQSIDIEKGKSNRLAPLCKKYDFLNAGLRKQPPPFGYSGEQSVARSYHNINGEIC